MNPESGTINYRYDAAGNLVWRDDNMGRQTCYSYDALNRVIQKIYFTGNYAVQGGNCAAVPGSAYLADSPTVSYSYDSANISYGIGRLAKVTNGISTTTILSYYAESGRAQKMRLHGAGLDLAGKQEVLGKGAGFESIGRGMPRHLSIIHFVPYALRPLKAPEVVLHRSESYRLRLGVAQDPGSVSAGSATVLRFCS
ncbi:MAG TPA: RHS repeat domain-containing protein [Bryobacteraceae bacterium]|nr:RHS repeat domain-containing protein [Bryobacteraceae bacterium]